MILTEQQQKISCHCYCYFLGQIVLIYSYKLEFFLLILAFDVFLGLDGSKKTSKVTLRQVERFLENIIIFCMVVMETNEEKRLAYIIYIYRTHGEKNRFIF